MTVDFRTPVALGATDVTVTRLGLGTAAIAGLYEAASDDQADDVVDACFAAGVRLFDTAPLYGYGLGEGRLGRALKRHPRPDAVVATKVGRLLRHSGLPSSDGDIFAEATATTARPVFDFSYAGVMQSLEESLDRLGLDHVEIVHIHDPDDHFDEALHGAYRALDELRRKGTIGAVGAGMNQSGMLAELARGAEFDCFLLAGRYTLLDQRGLDDLLPECERRNIGVIIGGVYNSGLLADPIRSPYYDYGPAPAPAVQRAAAMADVCARHDVPLRAAAIQFPFGHPAVTTVLAGARTAEELRDNASMLSLPIPDDLWHDLKAAGLLRRDVPTP